MKRLIRVLVLGMLVLAFVPVVNAEIADYVVISEVYVDAFNDTGSEWIELYNPTDSAIDIGGWTIGTPTSSKDATMLRCYIPSEKTISSYGFFMVADTNFSTKKDDSF